MGLSLLHQSSLGATYGVLGGRAIWFKPSLPVMFIISAVAGGRLTHLVGHAGHSHLTDRQILSTSVKREVSRLIGYVLLGYLYIKLWDWAATSYYSHAPGTANALERLQATTPYTTTFWWLEMVLGGLVPAFLLLFRPARRNERTVILALALIVFGVVINRWNVTLSGLVVPPDWSPGVLGNMVATCYAPTVIEIMVALGVLAYGLLGFSLGAKYLPIFHKTKEEAGH